MLSTPDPAIPFELCGDPNADLAVRACVGFRHRAEIATFDAIYDLNQSAAGNSDRIDSVSRVLFGRSIEGYETATIAARSWGVFLDEAQPFYPHPLHRYERSENLHLFQLRSIPVLLRYHGNVCAAPLYHFLVGAKVVPPAKTRRANDYSPAA